MFQSPSLRSLRLLGAIGTLICLAAPRADAQCFTGCKKSCATCQPIDASCCPAEGCCPTSPEAALPSAPSDDPALPPSPDAAATPAPPSVQDTTSFDPLQSTLLASDSVAVPNMMGNLLRAYRGVTFQYLSAGDFAVANSSGAVSFRNTKIAENNSAIPRDRISFRYNYFRNALTVRGLGNSGQTPQLFGFNTPIDLDAIAAIAGESRVIREFAANGTTLPTVKPAARDYDVHLYTLSAEKTFFDDQVSMEVRVPYQQGLDETQDFTAGAVREDFLFQATPGQTLGASGGEFQDVQLILKAILLQDACKNWTISGGLGLSLPSGPDLNATVVDYHGDAAENPGEFFPNAPPTQFNFDQRIRKFKIENDTFALSPFLAMVRTPNERTFMNGFFQVDVPLNKSDWRMSSIDRDLGVVIGFPFRADGPVQNSEQFSGTIRDQVLLHLDIGGGYWLYQNPCARYITGLASILELHYTRTMQDADIITVPAAPLVAQQGGKPEFQPRIGNLANNVDILDLTVGGHIVIGKRTTLAIGGVFPLRDGDDRTFDAEVSAQLNIYR